MSFISTKFSYNGIDSDTMKVSLVRVDTGMLKRNFGVQKTINKDKIRNKDIPVHYNSELQTYTIPITIAKINIGDTVWTLEERMKISEWLFPDDNFHEFISEDYPNLVFPLQFIRAEFTDNFNGEGYVELEAEMESPYPYTLPSYSQYDLTDNETTTIIEFENISNVLEFYRPIFQFELKGENSTSFKIKNLTVGGEETIFNNLMPNEVLCVDNLNQRIESSTGQERISNFNFTFLRLIKGRNRLEITGKGILIFKCSFPVMI